MVEQKNKRIYELITLFIGLGFLSYTVTRALQIPITHDEAFTIHQYVKNSFMEIINNHNATANNHILNSLLIKFFTSILGNNVFVIRLPNLLSHLLYISTIFFWFRKVKPIFLLPAGMILLNANPYFLDFFALARGYGLSFGFMIISIYMLYLYILYQKRKFIILAYLFGAFSVISSFILLYYYCGMIGVHIIFESIEKSKNDRTWKKFFSNFTWPGTMVLLTGVFLYGPVQKLVVRNELYGRGKSGFWKDTVITFIRGSSYYTNYENISIELIAKILVIILFFAFLISVIFLILLNYKFKKVRAFPIFLILAIALITSLVHHYAFNSELLVYRTTLFYFPLLMLCFILLPLVTNNLRTTYILSFLPVVLTIVLGYHTIQNMNIKYAVEWRYDASNEELLSDLENLAKKNNFSQDNKLNLGISWIFEPSLNYYIKNRDLNWINLVERNTNNAPYDYYYFEDGYYYPFDINIDTLKKIKCYPKSNTFLAKQK